MKFLLIASMLVASAFANANDEGWAVKCFEKDGHDYDLAYIIKVDHGNPAMNRQLELLDCTYGHDNESKNCRERGELKKYERQDETCLVLKHRGGHGEATVDNGSWSLCYEQQETLNPRLVPVTVTDDRQESRIYCERSLLRIL